MDFPGGNLVAGSGGYLQLWNWQSGLSITSPPEPFNYRWLDVAWWRLIRRRVAKKLTYSGCFGATRRRFICSDWEVHCRVWWDFVRTPEVNLTDGDTLAVKLVIGAESTWQGSPYPRANQFAVKPPTVTNQATLFANGLGLLPQGSTFLPSYCSPQALFTLQYADCSSTGDEDGIVWQDITIEGDSLMWYIIDQQAASEYADYVTRLGGQNFLAYF